MKHTTGKWNVESGLGDEIYYITSERGDILATVRNDVTTHEPEANAKLIAEAGTVANETGFTPRQLADQNKELREALESLKQFTEGICLALGETGWENSESLLMAEKALKPPKP